MYSSRYTEDGNAPLHTTSHQGKLSLSLAALLNEIQNRQCAVFNKLCRQREVFIEQARWILWQQEQMAATDASPLAHLSTTHSLSMWCTRFSWPSASNTAQRLRVRKVQYSGLRLAASTRACSATAHSRANVVNVPGRHHLIFATAFNPSCVREQNEVTEQRVLTDSACCSPSPPPFRPPSASHQAAPELCCVKGCEEAQRAHSKAHHRWQRSVLSE
jgi:hypothetical protein